MGTPPILGLKFICGLSVALIISACGSRNLSALGNPGDYCTESTACTDGSLCRQTEDGFRCVGGQTDSPVMPTQSRGPAGEDVLAPSAAPPPVEETPQEDTDVEEPSPPEEDEDGQPYLPPSRRRRGG